MNEENDSFTYCEEVMKMALTERAGLEELKEFVNVSLKSKMRDEVEEWVREYCDMRSLCYKCLEPLEVKTHKESRGEYLGFSCSEDMYDFYCPNCG